jgi:DNA polymerase-1
MKKALEEASVFGELKGHATTVSGLRRQIPIGSPAHWVQNFLRNTPIQGSAADIFKSAVIAIDKELQGTSGKIILLIHDAVVVECDANDLDSISEKVRSLMSHALRAFYPELTGKVDINKTAPHCWNKDGHADSLDKFLQDPSFNIDSPNSSELIKTQGSSSTEMEKSE